MEKFPHQYQAEAVGGAAGIVRVETSTAPTIDCQAPPEFGGPQGYWSPETLLLAAIANCFILTFRALSQRGEINWSRLHCTVDGTLDKTSEGLRFTEFTVSPILEVAPGTDKEKALSLLERSERQCLVSNSLNGQITLNARVL